MSIRPLPVSFGASRRSAVDHDLSYLLAEIESARAAERLARGSRHPGDTFRSDAARLASSLGAYARALEGYRLPIPPVIRDELRLRQGLS
ncbi:hypothetical protein [Kribbella kalugense]|jgi:hypothetical protein|uniref:Uncharacterized protein n=1 Tax=Kribbella kalugense TaxID=2512221 RepID=A0A4R7ZDW9_9ACTN|nr:hypothetical protein [Kribbella kalugense]TDW15793.1 hypothetical protein EV650_7287 [Kribbella kalugense]